MNNNEQVSVKEWIFSMLVMGVPVLNIVLMIKWAMDKNISPSKSNFFKAQLMVMAVACVVAFFGTLGMIMLAAMFN